MACLGLSSSLVSPGSDELYVQRLRAAAKRKDLKESRRIHVEIVGHGGPRSALVWNTLIETYGKCGSPDDARWTLDDMVEPSDYSWDLLIAAYAETRHLREAKFLFDKLPGRRGSSSRNALVAAYVGAGRFLEARSLLDAMPSPPEAASLNLLLMGYVEKGQILEAKKLFDSMGCRDNVSWTTLMQGYLKIGDVFNASQVFRKMPYKDVVAWTVIVMGYAESGQLLKARQMFDKMPKKDTKAWTAMMKAYATRNFLEDARELFELMPEKNVVAYTTMISAYAQNRKLDDAIKLFEEMRSAGYKLDSAARVVMISTYGRAGKIDEAIRLFNQIACKKLELAEENAMLSALVRNDRLEQARAIFDKMQLRDVVSYTIMVKAYGDAKQYKDAIKLYWCMEDAGIWPNKVTFITMIDICADARALLQGESIHRRVVRTGFDRDPEVLKHLVRMYARCRKVVEARQAFDAIACQDDQCWSTMVEAYANKGCIMQALELLPLMNVQGYSPSKLVFLILLSACRRYGFVKEAKQLSMSLCSDYSSIGITPELLHCINQLENVV